MTSPEDAVAPRPLSPLPIVDSAPPDDVRPCARRFHLGLYVEDLARSVRFYQLLFGAAPVKRFAEYARFESDAPPVVLTLKRRSAGRGGPLNHVGVRLADSTSLVALQRRFEEAGVATQRQDGVACCYAAQTKFWVTDPDRVLWELYVLEADLDHAGADEPPAPGDEPAAAPDAVWEHRLGDPFPLRLPFADGDLEEVRFSGTLNALIPAQETARRLAEAARVLRPGGRLVVLGLIGDKPYSEKLDLPGQASKCEYLPPEYEPPALLAAAGFSSVYYEELHDVNCLHVAGIDLRSFRLAGRRPSATRDQPACFVVYLGPFERVRLDNGAFLPRGERALVDSAVADLLRTGATAAQFAFPTSRAPSQPTLDPSSASTPCCGERPSGEAAPPRAERTPPNRPCCSG